MMSGGLRGPGAPDESVEVVEDHAIDGAAGEVRQQLAEPGADHDPVGGAVVLDDLLLLNAEVSFSLWTWANSGRRRRLWASSASSYWR
jgi:hypothetical protein